MAFPIADRLDQAGVPFIIATGYNSASLPERSAASPSRKAFNADEIVAVIRTFSPPPANHGKPLLIRIGLALTHVSAAPRGVVA
jgi:hypothetical protein